MMNTRARNSVSQQENAGGLRGKPNAAAAAPAVRTRAALGDVANRGTRAGLRPAGLKADADVKKAGYGAQSRSNLARPPLHSQSLKENAAAPKAKTNVFGKAPALRSASTAVPPRVTRQSASAEALAPAPAPPSPEDVEMRSPGKASFVEEASMASVTEDAMEAPTSYSAAMIPDIDEGDEADPQLAAVFTQDIYNYLRCFETQQGIKDNFLQNKIVTPRMRGILVDWLHQVHTRFHMLPETIYMTVQVIDRYLEKVTVAKDQLQLVGVTGMLIAAKYEEMYAPEVNDFVYITDDTYKAKEILAMELRMLGALGCNLGRPLPIHFLRRFSKAAEADYIVHTMSKYFMELGLCDHLLAPVLPSKLAGAALLLTLTLLRAAETKAAPATAGLWSPTLIHYSGLKLDDVAPVLTTLAKLLHKVHTDKSKLQAVRNKFAAPKFHAISKHDALSLDALKTLAE